MYISTSISLSNEAGWTPSNFRAEWRSFRPNSMCLLRVRQSNVQIARLLDFLQSNALRSYWNFASSRCSLRRRPCEPSLIKYSADLGIEFSIYFRQYYSRNFWDWTVSRASYLQNNGWHFFWQQLCKTGRFTWCPDPQKESISNHRWYSDLQS